MSTCYPAPAAPRLLSVVFPKPLPLEELFERRYRPQRLPGSPASTVEQYLVQLRHLDRYRRQAGDGNGPLTIRHLSRESILGCRAWLIQSRGSSVATANKAARHLASIWRFVIDEGLIDEAPRTIRRIKEPVRRPRAWHLADLSKILDAAAGLDGLICAVKASVWWQAFVLTLYDTGFRVSTMMALVWRHFDAQNGALRVPAELVKDDEELVRELSHQTLSALLAMPSSEVDKMFPWPFDPDRKWRVLRKYHRRILQAAGLPWRDRQHGGFHIYRRTTASYLKRHGGNPTEHLGHSAPSVTEVYLDRTICRRRREVDRLPRPKTADPAGQLRLF